MRQLLAAVLLTSALPLTAAACGFCIEDKVAALSVVVDARRASPAEVKNRIEQKLLPWRLGLKLLRTIEKGKLSAPA